MTIFDRKQNKTKNTITPSKIFVLFVSAYDRPYVPVRGSGESGLQMHNFCAAADDLSRLLLLT